MAIKILPPRLTQDHAAKQRFLRKAKPASALDHPNICTIHEINETGEVASRHSSSIEANRGIPVGSLAENDKAFIFPMDYPHRKRIKIWGRARHVEDEPDVRAQLVVASTAPDRRGRSSSMSPRGT